MSRLPASIREAVEAAAARHDLGGRVIAEAPVAGGCINQGARASLESGADVFVKWNASAPPGMFEAEADGLAALRAAALASGDSIRVPEAFASGSGPDGSWLLLEYVPSGPPGPHASRALGRGLAAIHGSPPTAGHAFGWSDDNWIGRLPQSNRAHGSWPAFWSAERIEPQLERARRAGFCRERTFDRLLPLIPEALAGITASALLHGDLWSGNVFVSDDMRPVLIDPAVYRGDGEVDLAMTELFGGFDAHFRAAYHDVRPISDAYRSYRRDLYQLYYLLVHVNLFGAGYEPGARTAAERVVAALG